MISNKINYYIFYKKNFYINQFLKYYAWHAIYAHSIVYGFYVV